ncbi:MAG TPA: hypothetical protein VG894_07885 [Bauldia sp.]|nr:hypothetical protein [Bauldia sp.]
MTFSRPWTLFAALALVGLTAAALPATAQNAPAQPPAAAAPTTQPPAGDADSDNQPPAYPTTQFASDDATSATVTSGGVTVTITMDQLPDADPDNPTPVLHVTVGGQEVLRAIGVAGEPDDPQPEASIAEMDASNGLPEVYFVSGCCNTVIVAEQIAGGGWQAVPIGDFGDSGATLEDLDGDGIAEIATVDTNFITRFDCTACSTAPRVVYTVKNGAVVDETTEPRFLPAHREWLQQLTDAIQPDAMWSSPGFLAGWLAEKIRVGEGADGWQQLNSHWDFTHDDGEQVCPNGDDPDTCDAKDRKTMKFPDRLRLFLTANGYTF